VHGFFKDARVISCERVLCSAAARRRKDSFKWLGTYAPMKTPLRFAIYRSLSFENWGSAGIR